jgi:hypothetical protein
MILRNYPLARIWLGRSVEIRPTQEAEGYLEMVKEKMAEGPPGQSGGAIKRTMQP